MTNLRRYFITGLLVILPLFVTLYFIFIIFRFIDGLWGNFIDPYIKEELGFSLPGVGLILGILTITAIGFFTSHFFSKKIFSSLENWFLKFPFIRQVYPAIKQIVHFFVSKEKIAFKKVVLVEYPSKGIWSVGFITNDGFKEAEEKTGRELLHVFIGTSPTPLSGFFVMVPKNEVKFLDVSVEQGLKLIVSGGIIKP
ncbi:MAG: DUF502 domain-containing protein [Candidatus Omnitrophota bacterium]